MLCRSSPWLTCLAREFSDPIVMAVAGRRLPLTTQTETERLCTWMHDKHQRFVVDRGSPQWFEIVNFGGIGTGMNMAFRRRAFDIWPGFHERLAGVQFFVEEKNTTRSFRWWIMDSRWCMHRMRWYATRSPRR